MNLLLNLLAVNENENIEVCVIDNLDLFDNITPRASKDKKTTLATWIIITKSDMRLIKNKFYESVKL